MANTRGGNSETLAEAGRAEGDATASTHERSFYKEIGREGGDQKNADRVSAHHAAACHHSSAAHHHRQAAYHHSRGENDDAESHAKQGHAHSQQAYNLSRNALGQFTSQNSSEDKA